MSQPGWNMSVRRQGVRCQRYRHWIDGLRSAGIVLVVVVGLVSQAKAQQATGADPNVEEQLTRGDAALAAGQEDAALESYSAALAADPKNVRAKVGRAEIAMRRQLAPQAIAGFSDAIAAEPKVAAHYARRAAALSLEGKHEEAVADWTKAIELDDKQPAYLVGRGDAQLAQKKVDSAIVDFVDAKQSHPDYLPAHLHLGDAVLRSKKDLTAAVKAYNDALRVDPKSVEALFGRGDAYLQDEQYTAALADLTRAIALDPKHAGAHSLRGDVELVQGNYREAIDDYRKAVELDPRNAIFHCDLGVALVRSGDFKGAIQSLSQAIRRQANMSRAFVYLAVAEFSQERPAEAQTALAEAKRLDPKWNDAKLERRHSRYMAFANGSDKAVEVKVWYYTDAVDGTPKWFPTEPGQGEPITHKIKAHDTLYPAYNGARLPVTKLRFTVAADDGSFRIDKYEKTDLSASPPDGYVDTATQTLSFPIVAPVK